MINLIPCQMDICFSEICNQSCDYCWVKKTSRHVLNFNSVRLGIDLFFNLPLSEQTITFTICEPLMFPELYMNSIDYIFAKQGNKRIKVVTTTNGLMLESKIKKFLKSRINRYKDTFILNISIDGKKESHDFHRKIKDSNAASSFDVAWGNFSGLPKDKVRVISTVTYSEISLLKENISFILENGFKRLDIFPDVFKIWGISELNKISRELTFFINLINLKRDNSYDLKLLNRLWGGSCYNKILLGSDGNFYFFEGVVAIPYSQRKKYIVGNVRDGLNLIKRLQLYSEILEAFPKKTRKQCANCNNLNFCNPPILLFIWCSCYGYDFNKYFKNFCSIANTFINLASCLKVPQ